MSLTWVLIIIGLALGAILGNILMLKHTANIKMPSLQEREAAARAKQEQANQTKPQNKD